MQLFKPKSPPHPSKTPDQVVVSPAATPLSLTERSFFKLRRGAGRDIIAMSPYLRRKNAGNKTISIEEPNKQVPATFPSPRLPKKLSFKERGTATNLLPAPK